MIETNTRKHQTIVDEFFNGRYDFFAELSRPPILSTYTWGVADRILKDALDGDEHYSALLVPNEYVSSLMKELDDRIQNMTLDNEAGYVACWKVNHSNHSLVALGYSWDGNWEHKLKLNTPCIVLFDDRSDHTIEEFMYHIEDHIMSGKDIPNDLFALIGSKGLNSQYLVQDMQHLLNRWEGVYDFEEPINEWMVEYTAQQEKQTISDAIHTSNIAREKKKM